MAKRKYDLIFGLGQACGCSQTLRRAGLQLLSFPGDWTAPIFGNPECPPLEHDTRDRADFMTGNLDDLFRPEDFRFHRPAPENGKDIYINHRTRYIFNHDFPMGCDFREEFPKVFAKYRRRQNRMREIIRKSRRVLIVRMDMPGGPFPATLDDCRYARKRLAEFFAPVRFDCLLISHEENRPFEQRLDAEVESGLFHIAFDYLDRNRAEKNMPDLVLTANAIENKFSVRDYRTREERQRFDKARRRRKYAKIGAKNWFDYQCLRLRKLLGLG